MSLSSRARPRILVVDDDDNVRDLLAFLLDEAGFAVTTAEDGVVAMESLAASVPDGVVLDVMMPRASGWEVWTWMQARAALVDVPVVIWTASGLASDPDGRPPVFCKNDQLGLLRALRTAMPASC